MIYKYLNFYTKNIDKWMYINGTTRAWYKEGSQPSGYTKYVRIKTNNNHLGSTATSGETIVLYAKWN